MPSSPQVHDAPPNAAAARPEIRGARFWLAVETGIYTAVAFGLAITAVLTLIGFGIVLWQGFRDLDSWDVLIRGTDRLLLVLMEIEILHTVRISIRSHVLTAEPFLIVGLIASIRRILVIALQAANVSISEGSHQGNEAIFRESMIELALLGFLVLILVGAIAILRRSPASPEEIQREEDCQ